LLQVGDPGSALVQLLRPFVQRARAFLRRQLLRAESRLRGLESLCLCLELDTPSLELRRPRIELADSSRMDALLLLQLRLAPLELGQLHLDEGSAPLLCFERRRSRRDPVAALLELGRERPQLAGLHVQLAVACACTLDLCLGTQDVLLLVAKRLERERESPLPLGELGLRLLEELRARVEVGGDLSEPP
jgi:hypothetical protein